MAESIDIKQLRLTAGLSQQQLSDITGIPRDRIAKWEQRNSTPKADDYEKIVKATQVQSTYVLNDEGQNYQAYRRAQKNAVDPESEGVTYIPIAAQAGYAKKIIDPMFKSNLQKLFIPGMPYRGERYRIFEVEGNSMEPKFKEHFHVVAERIDPEYWKRPKNYYAYVLVTEEDVLLKRIFKKNDDEWILISDNPLYPQFIFNVSELKELWLIKRKMDWEMAPPEKFVIDENLMK